MDSTFYCPNCFAGISASVKVCPVCSIDIKQWEKEHSYFDRLVHSLKHPNPEARMGCILTLGNQRNLKAAIPLAECALLHPVDVWQDMEIIRSLKKLPICPETKTAYKMLLEHPARVIREEAEQGLSEFAQQTKAEERSGTN
jgi:predicted RNA-binding protein with PUA-like domain